MNHYKIETSKNKDDLAKLACQKICENIMLTTKNKDRFRIALAGGSTPSAAYKLLSKELLPWDKVDIFLGDERWVDHKNELSNSFMLRNTLLSSSPADKANFYPFPTIEFSSPEESASFFNNKIEELFNSSPPKFDLILLGLGDDGHTASLFPETESIYVTESWVTSSQGKGIPRLTLTAPVLSAANKVIFLVSGKSKRQALTRLINPLETIERTPAKLVQPSSEVLILADLDAISSS